MSDAPDKKSLKRLISAQLGAVAPSDNVWLSASAGTGKTQVLTARVIRLLLEKDVEPENLLCITFTKAGAAEMAERINQLLASWVQKSDQLLSHDLEAIGAAAGPEALVRARQLFAKVLDAPGGGLQIMTIHGFCQSLLGSFPEEAGLVPGFKPIEGREQQELQREALSEMILAAEARKDGWLIPNLQLLSLKMGEDAARKFLHKCGSAPDVMEQIPDDHGAVKWARGVSGVSFDGPVEAFLEASLSNEVIESDAIETIARLNMDWCKHKPDTKGYKRATTIRNWLSATPAQRALSFNMLHGCWTSSKGEPMIASKGSTPTDPPYAALAFELHEWTKSLSDQVTRAQYADRLAKALLVGKSFADQYAKTKHALGVVDFDDMIRKTADLLNTRHMADWVRFKLDRQINHILVDEAQDTNKAQWDIIRALSDDFYSGCGQNPERTRTIFSVGDFKQAIYGFQGTAPERYREAGEAFADRIEAAELELQNLALSRSFRSTAPILDFVNAVITTTGAGNFGITDEIEEHYSEKAEVGLVQLLSPVTPETVADDNDDDDEETWVTSEKRRLAEKLAEYTKALIDERPWLETQGRHLRPGDIMFLLRARGDLASLLVAQLHERNVPVAGIDRLRLLQPLVVQDLLAAVKFVLQPGDDLSLACLLVSPLIGWDQDKLLRHGYRGKVEKTLWQHLREQPQISDELEPLRDMLASADYTTVYHFLEQIISGPTAGRRKFAARLGPESLVPMEEMLNAAMQFEQQQGGGLQAFLAWFDRGDIEIKRDGESGANEVRVMTVHGAKGLQSPVVILADTTSDPRKKPDQSAELIMDEGKRTPLLPIRKTEQSGRLAQICEMQKERELQEHKRLLYVAMTRAEERLIMGGALGVSCKGVAPGDSWYTALRGGMEALGCEWEDDARFGLVMRHVGVEGMAGMPVVTTAEPVVSGSAIGNVSDWLFKPAPDEGRPPRPLVPSRLEDDDYGDAPATLAKRAAAERGKLIHALFERITDAGSLDAAERWLARNVTDPAIDKARILKDVRGVIANSDWSDFFGPNARAEVPLAAVVGEAVISGRIDRLIIEPGLVRILDFKTDRSVPPDEALVSVPFLRQMAHYVAALETIFDGHKVEASLLFTYAPKLITLSDSILAPHKPLS